jgi:hypothetical protein
MTLTQCTPGAPSHARRKFKVSRVNWRPTFGQRRAPRELKEVPRWRAAANGPEVSRLANYREWPRPEYSR